jgi:hypothetical protein
VSTDAVFVAGTWSAHELRFTATAPHANPYTEVDLWVDFIHDDGTTLRRPGFSDGADAFAVRFAAAGRPGRWTWTTSCPQGDPGLDGQTGNIVITEEEDTHRFRAHGFWTMSPGGRSLVHADGTPAVMVADTPWALPWRATPEQVNVYAADRHRKGFNAALLMTVQPDMDARGPADRGADGGFAIAFTDLADGHLNEPDPQYFRDLDVLLTILVDHEIVPVLQPVFFGFGWKGLRVAGPVVPPEEYARYCRYLVARYGAQPAIYLVGADGTGLEPQVEAGGQEVHRTDSYAQPTGIHYRPHSTADAHQDAAWVDFQWCQTGHGGDHIPERVTSMLAHTPIKAVANGEPTYENGGETGKAVGWWQGHEAWSNLCAGGTMGVVYGAGSLWQWVLRPGETGQEAFFTAPEAGWRQALDFEGSTHVGRLGRILDGLPTTDMVPEWELAICPRGVSVPGQFYLAYTDHGGDLRLVDPDRIPPYFAVVDPRTGNTVGHGTADQGSPDAREGSIVISSYGSGPRLFIFTNVAVDWTLRSTEASG